MMGAELLREAVRHPAWAHQPPQKSVHAFYAPMGEESKQKAAEKTQLV